MNSKDSEPVVVSTPAKFTFQAALALTTVGSAASGAIVSTGPFVVDPGGFSLVPGDGEADFVLNVTYSSSSTTFTTVSFYVPGGNENRMGSAYRASQTVTAFAGGPKVVTGIVLGGRGTLGGPMVPFGRGEESGSNNWAPLVFVEGSINGGSRVAGFAQIEFNGASSTIMTIWYSDTGAPVQMQGGAVSEIPEPSGLTLLALGAGGVLLRRRRKQAA